jgi:outer membrane receptor protein involved in Fe transport
MMRNLRSHALRRAFVLGCAASSTLLAMAPAFAQDSAEEEVLETVVITGSRIARPNLDSTVPVTSVSADDIFSTGDLAVGDLLNDLPALRSTYAQSNSQRFLGTTGLNLLDLRGLGTQRTLVLVNGRRHVGADILNNAVSPDVNTFPSDLIERIDVVTGGSSAVYGSDAIAGVVNFVLKRDFEGVTFRGQGGESKYGDASNYFGSVVAGTNFAEDRGNVALNFEYSKQDAFYASGRPNLRKNSNFVVVDTDPSGSDGVPDRLFYNDIRSVTVANGGLLQFTPAGTLAPCGRDPLGVAYRCTYLFNPDGSLTPQTGTRIGLAPNGNADGGNGTNSREGNLLAIYPQLERYSLNLLGHYTISEAFEPFLEAKYVRTKSLRQGSPAFFQGSTIGFGADLRERPRFDNPFLTDATRAQINAARVQSGLAPITNGATRLTLFYNMKDLGPRAEDATRETTRIVLGATGNFADDWKYEASVNYGEFKEKTDVLNNLNQQRFLLAMDATRDPQGNIVCRSKIDPAARIFYPFSDDDALAAALLADDVAKCVPYNPFGEGAASAAALDYLRYNSTSVGEIKQFDVNAFVSGNLGKWFSLPAGPVGVAAGVEYRSEENYWDSDDVVQAALTFYNAIPEFNPPKFEVKEVYGELRIPLLADKPFARELTLSTAGRLSDYKGKTGRVAAYNVGLDWAPIESLRFRAGLARAVRAPNLSDLYSEQSQNFATSFVDPCAARNIGTGAATRAANCRAAGIPTSFDYVYTASLQIVSGGNPDLKEETSDSLTVGLVFQPDSVPGLSVSVDYFDIKVDDVITAPSAQQIANACYDGKDLNNQFCSLFGRAGAAGGPLGEEPFRILEGSLQQTVLNYAARNAVGIDMEAGYKMSVGDGSLTTRVVYTHMLERNNYLDPTDPKRANRVLSELGDPEDAFNVNFDYSIGKLSLGYELRYIGKQVLNAAEDVFSVQGRPPENADWADRKYYPSVVYHDLRAGFDLTDSVNVYVGVDNVADKVPPLGLNGTGEGSGIYETRGRFFYTGVKAKF